VRPSKLWAAYEEAFRARDWPRVRSLFADDIVAIDHRPLGFGEIRGADAVLTYVRSFVDLSPSAAPRQRELLAESEHGYAALIEVRGGSDEAQIGFDYILVAEIRDGRGRQVLFFPVELRDEALRAFAAL
jgi:hypothetical protein